MLFAVDQEMSVTLIIEFLAALPKLVDAINKLIDEQRQMRLDSQEKALNDYKESVKIELKKITEAKTDEERKKLALALAIAVSK